MNIAKTVGIGLAVGSAAIAVGSAVMHKQPKQNSAVKNMKKTAGKAVHSMTEFMNGVETMLK